GVWFADENGKLVMGNPAGIEIWGAEPKVGPKKYDVFKARRLPSREIIQPDDWALAHTINKGIAITNELLEIEAFDGKNKIILNHTFPVFDNEDNVEGAIVINQDITTEKMKELRLSKVNKCLLNLGSDFNENINSITSLAGKLLDGAAAFYNKFDDTRDLLISKSQWNAPPDFKKEDSPYGHVCYETIISGPEVQYIPDLLKTKYATSDPNVQKYDLRSYLGHLVKAEDEVFGILCVVFTEETIVSEDDEKLIGILASAIAAEEERLSYTNKLKLSEERFRNVVESISDGIIELDLVNNKAYFSDRYYQMLGYEPNEFEPSYQAWMKAINPRDIDRVEKRFKEYISGKRGDFNVEYRAVHKSGELVWVQLKGKVEEYSDIGEPLKFIATQIDMTEHKKLEEMKKNRLIVQEVHHRVKNNLQVISSLLNMESRKLENEHIKHVFQDSQNRIRSMALAHEKLYGADNLASVEISDYIQSLSSYLIQSHNRNHIKIKLNIDSDTIYASMDIVVPLGLILNEIITNSLKHAFYNMEEGTINISFYQIDDKYHLEIEDNGIGISHDFDLESSNSLGVKIIDMLVAQLGGD
ncbi:PAS domain S-box protein, partial [Methanosalsum natronophilum]